MPEVSKRIGQILVDAGLVNESQLARVLKEQKKRSGRLGTIIVSEGFATKKAISGALGKHFGMEVVDIDDYDITPDVIESMPGSLAQFYQVIPIAKEDGVLTVALDDPYNISAIDDLRLVLDMKVNAVLAYEEDIVKAIEKYYGIAQESIDELVSNMTAEAAIELVEEEEEDVTDLRRMANQAPVIKLVNFILLQGIKNRASDIHIEPFEKELKVRYRIDGVLHEAPAPHKRFWRAIISRIKIAADLNIAESRLPQDGRIKLDISGREIDLRVSCLPTVFGESVVIRILDKGSLMMKLEDLGFLPDTEAAFMELIKKPNGIILDTGPTGCGKTTTLYAALARINKPDVKIITVEDPVEYKFYGIIQQAIRSKIGLTFGRALRHILRQDPDIIMVGEIRDLETAEIAVQASLTGHLVFSTLHTNDAPSTITRLIDMGIEPFLITSSLEAILAQRLVRTICPKCKEPYRPDPMLLAEMGLTQSQDKDITFYRGRGCRACDQMGYKGRIGIYELLVLDDPLRDLILSRASTGAITAMARESGMRTMREDGWQKVIQGITTIDEVVRVTEAEEHA